MKRIGTTQHGILVEMTEEEYNTLIRLALTMRGASYADLYRESRAFANTDENMERSGVDQLEVLGAIADWVALKGEVNGLRMLLNHIEQNMKVPEVKDE